MSKEGIPTIIIFFGFSLVLGFTGFIYQNLLLIILCFLALVLSGFAVYFFRDPVRIPVDDPFAILSPADGVVIDISTVNEPVYLKKRVTRISIFLSLFNVHVNYVPYNGTVDHVSFSRGNYFKANTPAASRHNVSSFIGLYTPAGKMAFKQLTGMVARRIVCRLKPDQMVKAGEKFGIIKFGSRMEVFLPESALPAVKTGDRVFAAESVIGFVNEKH